MKTPIQSVAVTYLAHATEDQAKIQGEVDRILGIPAEPTLERMVGHFGNEIVRAEIHVIGESAWEVFRSLFSKIGPDQKKEIVNSLSQFLDEHSAMFLRFDKQALINGSLRLGNVDSVRIKIKPRKFLAKGGAIPFYRDLLNGV